MRPGPALAPARDLRAACCSRCCRSSLVVFALFTYWPVQTDSTTQINAQLTALGALKENQINDWAASRVVDINYLARSPDVIQLVREH